MKKTIIYDLETTGAVGFLMWSGCHQILQIAAYCIETQECFESLILPKGIKEIPPQSSDIHHIYEPGQNSMEDVWDDLLELFGKENEFVFVAHNNNGFDEPMLRRHVVIPDNITFFDSLPWLRTNLPDKESYCLGDLYKNLFNEELDGAHNALVDVKALARIYETNILPNLRNSKSEDPKIKRIRENVLTSVKYLGPYRSMLICRAGFDSVSNLYEHFIDKGNQFDKFLYSVVKVKDLSHRRSIIAEVLNLKVYDDNEMSNFMVKLDNDIDYYIKHRYFTGLVENEKKDNKRYNKGLFQLKNYKD